MARIIVTADADDSAAVLLEESVESVHISSAHAAGQLIERLRWALADADELRCAPSRPSAARTRAPRARVAGYSAASALA